MQPPHLTCSTLPPNPRPRAAYYDLGIPFIGAVWNGFSITYDPANGHSPKLGVLNSPKMGLTTFATTSTPAAWKFFPCPAASTAPSFQAADGTIYALIMSGLSADHGHHLMVFDAQARTFSSLGRPAPAISASCALRSATACCTWAATNWPNCSATTRKSGALTNSAARLLRPPTA